MTALGWEETPLARSHDRATFDCGDGNLDAYLKRYARQNHGCGGATCFVAVPRETPSRILGFYTLSPAAIEFSRTPAVVARSGTVPCGRAGGRRCGVADRREGRSDRGLVRRTWRGATVGCAAVAGAAVCTGGPRAAGERAISAMLPIDAGDAR